MTFFVPCDFYPVEKVFSRMQQKRLHKRVKRLVNKGLTEKPYHYRMPRRILVPLAAILSLLFLIGCTAADPEMRETVVRTAEKVSAVIEKILTREEERIDPYAVQVGVSSVGEESGVTVTMDKFIRDGTNAHMKLTFASPVPFDGYILQCDALVLSRKEIIEGRYKTREKWTPVLHLRWGEIGILAGDILSLLEEGQSEVSLWLEISPDRIGETVDLPTGEYRLEIVRLFAADDHTEQPADPSSYFACTEYGDFTIPFHLTEEISVIPETTLTPNLPFLLGGTYFEEKVDFVEGVTYPDGVPMVLESIRFHPLYIEVLITTEVQDNICVLPGYEQYPFAPIEILRNLTIPAMAYGLTGEDYHQFSQVGFKNLQATFRDGVKINVAETYGSFNPQFDKSSILYHITTTEPLLPEDLQALTLVPFGGGESIVIWEAE